MGKVKWKWNLPAFAELRNDPRLVDAMRRSADTAAQHTPYEVEVEVWPHRGRRTGPRTAVQIWANSPEARRRVNDNPGDLTAVLNRMDL
jgi:hypothetical protein